MGRELGRISGPLLAENLLRNGNNLAFETNLLYLDVVNGWIGIKNATPTRILNITGKTDTTNLIVDTSATVANLEFTTSQIQNVSGIITLSPNQSLNPTVNVPRLTTAFFDITTNSINNTVLNSNIVLDPSGTGQLVVTTTNVDIRGGLHATGNITCDGSIVFGDSDTDNVTFNADINSNIIPNVNNISNLGSVTKEWRNLYSHNLSGNDVVSSTLTVTGNINVSGDTIIKGSVTLGNEATDTITIYDHLTQSINPKITNTYTLGKVTGTPKIWNTLYAGLLNVDAVTRISSNTITTLTTNTDLQLAAAGTGIVSVVTTDVDITNNLTVLGSSNLQAVGIIGTLDLPGSYTYTQTGNASRTGATNITGNVTVNGANIVQFQDIKFDGNKITTTLANNDLTFTANGTGIVKVVNTDVQVDNNLTVSLSSNADSVTATSATANAYDIGSVYITGNTITTDTLNTNLALSANGTGIINVTLTDVTLTNNLTVLGSSNLQAVGIIGTLDLPGSYTYTQTGNVNRTGNTGITGTLTVNPVGLTNPVVQFQNINITNNIIATTVTNSDLTFTANGTGIVKVVNTDVQVDNNLTVQLILNANSLQTASSITAVDFNVGSLYIKDNISVVPTNTNLILSAYTGKNVHLVTSDVNVAQNLTIAGPFTVDGTSTLKAVTVVGAITQIGNIVQTGDTSVTGTFAATGNISVTGPSSFLSVNNVKLDANTISATATNANLEFRANGTGGVVLERYLKFANNNISNIFDSNNIDLAFNNLVLAEDGQNLILESGDFYLADTLLDGDFSIKFTPNGTGNLVINSNKAFAVAYGNNSNRVLTDLGEIRQNSTTNLYEGKSGAGNVSFTGIYDTDGNTYVTAGATDNILRFGVNGIVKATISSTKLFSDILHADNVRISGTTIDNLINSNDLILSPNGTGTVKVNNIGIAGNKFTNNTNTALLFDNTGTGYVQFAGTYGILLPRGLSNQRSNSPELGETRYNTTSNYLEVFDGTYWINASGSSNVATLDEIQAELDLFSLILG